MCVHRIELCRSSLRFRQRGHSLIHQSTAPQFPKHFRFPRRRLTAYMTTVSCGNRPVRFSAPSRWPRPLLRVQHRCERITLTLYNSAWLSMFQVTETATDRVDGDSALNMLLIPPSSRPPRAPVVSALSRCISQGAKTILPCPPASEQTVGMLQASPERRRRRRLVPNILDPSTEDASVQ